VLLQAKQELSKGTGIALTILEPGAGRRWMFSGRHRPIYPRKRYPVHIAQKAGWTSGPILMDPKTLATTGVRTPDRPFRSSSLYRLTLCHIWYTQLRKACGCSEDLLCQNVQYIIKVVTRPTQLG